MKCYLCKKETNKWEMSSYRELPSQTEPSGFVCPDCANNVTPASRLKQIGFLRRILTESEYQEILVDSKTFEDILSLYSVELIDSVIVIPIADSRFVIKNEDFGRLENATIPTLQEVAQTKVLENPVFVEIGADGLLIVD